MADSASVFYWDTSALLSFLFADCNSETARTWAQTESVHLLSSLAHTEACAVMARMTREGMIDQAMAEALRAVMGGSPWRMLNGLPERNIVVDLAKKWPLKGADLWHLGLALSLKNDLPEIRLLTFDVRLLAAAAGEGMTP